MKFKTGEKVVFIGSNDTILAWKLNVYETYIVTNHAFNKHEPTTMFVSVSNLERTKNISWFAEDLFISLVDCRKMKLEKINDRRR